MLRWTEQQVQAYEQRQAHKPRRVADDSVGNLPPRPEPKPAVCDAPDEAPPGAPQDAPRRVVRVTSCRRRLIDPDNLCAKYFVDALKYAGAILDDREQDITLEVRQHRVHRKEDERTIIEVI